MNNAPTMSNMIPYLYDVYESELKIICYVYRDVL